MKLHIEKIDPLYRLFVSTDGKLGTAPTAHANGLGQLKSALSQLDVSENGIASVLLQLETSKYAELRL